MPMALLYIVTALGAHTQVSKAAVAANGFPSGKGSPHVSHTEILWKYHSQYTVHGNIGCECSKESFPVINLRFADNNITWPQWPCGVCLRCPCMFGPSTATVVACHGQELDMFWRFFTSARDHDQEAQCSSCHSHASEFP